MTTSEQIKTIKKKLELLKKQDSGLKVFGAFSHGYKLNPPIKKKLIKRFETSYGIKLPEGYRAFIYELGDGGAGPYYGLEPLRHSTKKDLDYKDKSGYMHPSKPFPLTEAWNMEYEPDSREERKYFSDKWLQGLLRICNYGCGLSLNLVVNGSEYGHIWVDDRGNDGGLYPDNHFGQTGRTKFLDWYELWLDQSLEETSVKP